MAAGGAIVGVLSSGANINDEKELRRYDPVSRKVQSTASTRNTRKSAARSPR
jgi:hypothetical protein